MEKYMPSNGTEGMQFMDKFCEKCWHDRIFRKKQIGGCEIIARTMAYDINDPGYPNE